MPTRKRRIGFIPSLDVLKIIDRISEEENLSNSKVANILIEEALSARGLIENNKKDYFINNFQNFKKEISSLQNIFNEEDFKFIGQYNPPPERGFAFDNNKNIKELTKKVDYMGIHSGSSFAFTMRLLQHYSRIYFSN